MIKYLYLLGFIKFKTMYSNSNKEYKIIINNKKRNYLNFSLHKIFDTISTYIIYKKTIFF